MKIVYSPANGERMEFSFRPKTLTCFESEAIEEVGGPVWSNWDGFLAALSIEKGRALRATLWHELRQTRPEISFAGVVVRAGEIAAYPDEAELAEARAIADDPDTPEDVRAALLDALGKGAAEEASEISDTNTDSA